MDERVDFMDLFEKLEILSAAAKYDTACTSSGVSRKGNQNGLGNASACGICHSFSSDGRCISLLKVLMTNYCIYDCKYCANRHSNDIKRAAFTPRELADLTISFYRRNYIEGLFISSGIVKNPDYTCEQLIKVLEILRYEYNFAGYIHAKAIPSADSALINRLGMLADRMSVNIELPSEQSLNMLAPNKSKEAILKPMGFIKDKIKENKYDIVQYKKAPSFVPAGQSTQMIVGATQESDYKILRLTEGLYNKYKLKRVFFSAYVPINTNPLLPALNSKPPLLREHRLYQADWLLRFYGFKANELLNEKNQNFNPLVDPKCNWALNNMEMFPIEVNEADYQQLLRVPGIGTVTAGRILTARRSGALDFDGLKKMGVVLKRAQYFITCKGKMRSGLKAGNDNIVRNLISQDGYKLMLEEYEQLTLFDSREKIKEEVRQCLMQKI